MILVAGIGNVFLGDDAFGVELVRLLQRRWSPPHPLAAETRAVDFGIRGIDLGYALADHDVAILLDTVCRGAAPGTLYVIEPAVTAGTDVEPHSMTPDRVLRWIDPARRPRTLRLVGCEPATFGEPGFGQEGLSPPVRAALDEAARIVENLVRTVRA